MTTTTTERLVLTFSDGCDEDTIDAIIGRGRGYIARLTQDAGAGATITTDVEIVGGCVIPDVELGITFRAYDEDSMTYGEPYDLGLSHILELHIY